MLDKEYLAEFKRKTETRWETAQINPGIYGFQFIKGTKWNPGLKPAQITQFEEALSVRFPTDFRLMLQAVNGTDLPTLNVYGSSGEPHRESIGVYSYPRDLAAIQQHIKDVATQRREIAAALSGQGYFLEPNAGLVPIYSHRYIVCGSDPDTCTILSIHGTDAIVYADSLKTYLNIEFLKEKERG